MNAIILHLLYNTDVHPERQEKRCFYLFYLILFSITYHWHIYKLMLMSHSKKLSFLWHPCSSNIGTVLLMNPCLFIYYFIFIMCFI